MAIKGVKRKKPTIADEKYAIEFAENREKTIKQSHIRLTAQTEQDRDYFMGILEAIGERIRPTLKDKCEYNTNCYNFTPKQIFENTMQFFKISLQYGQPLTIGGIALFSRLKSDILFGWDHKEKLPDGLEYMGEFIDFVKMYNEYAMHKKQNPAGPIFALKNFGWKDKIEIEASSKVGALTDDERMAAQKRIAAFSEGKIAEIKKSDKTEEAPL